MAARGILHLSTIALGLGLAGWLVAGILCLASWLARRHVVWAERFRYWELRAPAWALSWLAAGVVSGAYANQEAWGRAWRWTTAESWSLVALLASLAYAQTRPGRIRRAVMLIGIVVTFLALWAGALHPAWPRLP